MAFTETIRAKEELTLNLAMSITEGKLANPIYNSISFDELQESVNRYSGNDGHKTKIIETSSNKTL